MATTRGLGSFSSRKAAAQKSSAQKQTTSSQYGAISNVLRSSGATEEQAKAITDLTTFAPTGASKVETAPTTPLTPTVPPVTDTEVQDLSNQGFKEGDVVPGKGVLTPEGTYKAPVVSPTDTTETYRQIAQQQPPNVDIDNAAESKSAVKQATETIQGSQAPTGGQEIMEIFDTDQNKELLNIEKMYQDFYSPKKQKESLLSTYNNLASSLGLSEINAELIDTKNIIEGTEDDIRTEITKANGFATESQVQAMTNARNKSLIKNYNTLLETKNALTEQIGNMMQYAQADRDYAAQQFESRMNFEMKKIEYGNQAKTFAATQLNNIVDKVGYAGLLSMTGGDAYTTAKIEQALGLGQGGLAQLATVRDEEEELRLQNLRLQNAKLGMDLLGSEIGGTSLTPMTEADMLTKVQDIEGIVSNPALVSSVGPTWLSRIRGKGLYALTGKTDEFLGKADQIIKSLSLDELVKAKASGATFGALDKSEWEILQSSASALNTWAVRDEETGKIKYFDVSEKAFNKEMNTILGMAKLDYVIKGGNLEEVGLAVMENGDIVSKNPDGTITKLSNISKLQ